MSALHETMTRRGLFRLMTGKAAEIGAKSIETVETHHLPVLHRPPGAQAEAAFLAACTRCGECIRSCPNNTLTVAGSETGPALGTPVIEPRRQPCRMCGKCSEVCPSGALKPEAPLTTNGRAVISEGLCFDWQGTMCQMCVNVKPHWCQALSLKNFRYPTVNRDLCVGCGTCEHNCPTEPTAIQVIVDRRIKG